MTTRRSFLQMAASLSFVSTALKSSAAKAVLPRPSDRLWRYAIALFQQPKYPPEFPHFEYVNPLAPRLGTVKQGALGTYDNFNPVVSGLKGNLAAGSDLIYETLLVSSLDEISAEYGLIAEAVNYSPDLSRVSFRLRPQAQWHDGKPITPDDVIFSFEAFKTHNPQLSILYRRVRKAVATGEQEVTFLFDGAGNRELLLIVSQLTILPEHWWRSAGKSRRQRNVAETTLEPPLGSGPYRIKTFDSGNSIVYERVENYWGRDLNVRVGQNNFDALRFDYFRDLTVMFQAFKAGDLDWHIENTAKNWATAYDFPAVQDGRIVREEFPIRNIGVMQAFAFNTRRTKFKDPQLRRAFNFAFDFETVNRELFYDQYTRITSYFQGTELACAGLPQGRELEILDPLRNKVPAEVFTTPYWNPVSQTSQAHDANLLEALRLLEAAGFAIRNLHLFNVTTGEPLTVEFMLADPVYERFVLFYRNSLERLGIDVVVRVVDAVQYENRLRNWEFDIVVAAWPESLTPGNEQRDYWGSRAANTPGSQNLIGIADDAIDTLIDHVISATDRPALVAATHALDRVLLWHNYVVPQWTYGNIRTARWNRFGKPDLMPIYGLSAFPAIWWWDAQRAAKTASEG